MTVFFLSDTYVKNLSKNVTKVIARESEEERELGERKRSKRKEFSKQCRIA